MNRDVCDTTTGLTFTVAMSDAEAAAVTAANQVTQDAVAADATQTTSDATTVNDLRAQYQTMLNVISADLTKLADANWLTLTVAQKAETLRSNQQDQLVGFRRLLNTLAILIRRTGMPS